ncbi:MAG TPA: hypothetical protein VHS80_08310, partial [Chthoniobacterales bacterium]|nr:hypothetical protein [Chthoniobacterales bacterium]
LPSDDMERLKSLLDQLENLECGGVERRFERKMRLPFTSITVLHSGLTDYNTSVIPYRNQYDHGIVEGGNSGSRKKR